MSLAKRFPAPEIQGMDTLIAAVFIGNILAAAFVWGMARAARYKTDSEIPWLVYAALILPVLFVLGALVTAEGLPPPLAALAQH